MQDSDPFSALFSGNKNQKSKAMNSMAATANNNSTGPTTAAPTPASNLNRSNSFGNGLDMGGMTVGGGAANYNMNRGSSSSSSSSNNLNAMASGKASTSAANINLTSSVPLAPKPAAVTTPQAVSSAQTFRGADFAMGPRLPNKKVTIVKELCHLSLTSNSIHRTKRPLEIC